MFLILRYKINCFAFLYNRDESLQIERKRETEKYGEKEYFFYLKTPYAHNIILVILSYRKNLLKTIMPAQNILTNTFFQFLLWALKILAIRCSCSVFSCCFFIFCYFDWTTIISFLHKKYHQNYVGDVGIILTVWYLSSCTKLNSAFNSTHSYSDYWIK